MPKTSIAGTFVAKKKGADLSDFQYAGALAAKGGKRFDLTRFDPSAKPFSSGSKSADLADIDRLSSEIDRLQDVLYADRRHKLLVVLQGTDTSGKDGTIRGVFSKTSALGVKTAAWKAPSDEELAHDYLWRIHQKVPAAGEIAIFNRSHYEDVLVPPVKGWIDRAETQRRYAQINDFERLLTETGTVVLKFLLHISKDEQRVRLQDRLDDPTKHWKFAVGDLEERTRWTEYQAAYDAAVAATGTSWAPWTIVPADSKTHRNLMIATVVVETLQSLKLAYPPGDPSLAKLKVT